MDGSLPGGEYGVDVGLGGRKMSVSGGFLGADLFDSVYGALGSQRMIKTGPPVPPPRYDVLRSMTNLTMLNIDDFLVANGLGCLVLEPADETFMEWVQRSNKLDLFIETSPGKWRLSPVLRNMFIELASLVDVLIKKNCHAHGLGIADLYMKKNIGGDSTLKVLLSYNVIQIGSNADVMSAMAAVGDIIDDCCQLHAVQLDANSTCFKNYFGSHNTLKHLQRYPDCWSDEEKICYIIMIIQGDILTMTTAINAANVDWKWHHSSRRYNKKAIQILEDICKHHAKRTPPIIYKYGTWNYIQLCRNVLKSFDIPWHLMHQIPDRSAFLKLMETWNSSIWTSLYEKIGPLGKCNC